MKIPPKVKKIWDIVSTVVVILFVLAAIFLLGSRLLGYKVYTVISGSMEPVYNVGDLVYVKEVDVREIKAGDDITFVLNDSKTVATHRVYRVDKNVKGLYFTTYGVNNLSEEAREALKNGRELKSTDLDTPVWEKNVQGVVQFRIPLLGYVSDFIGHPPGTWIAIGGVAVLIILAFLPDILGAFDNKKKPEENEEA